MIDAIRVGMGAGAQGARGAAKMSGAQSFDQVILVLAMAVSD
jgi:hypothetical protein